MKIEIWHGDNLPIMKKMLAGDGQNKPLIDTDREIQIAAVDVLDEVLEGIAKALLA